MSPLSYDDFHSRLLRAIDPEKATTKIIPATEPSQASSAAETGSQSDAPVQEPTASATSNTSTEPQNPPPSSSQQSSNVQNLLQERRIRLEAEHKAREEKEKAERAAKAKARREAADAAAAGQSSGSKPAEADYAARERKRKQEQRQERERVRQLVENDKVERKAREARRKEALAAERMEQAEFKPEEGTSSSASIPAGVCAVQVRLFDGTTVRTRFDSPATQTLVSVRAWIDSQLQSAEGVKPSSIPPYTFKHILAPRPSRTIEVGEEEQTLHDLDLTPTATLVLVPVQGYTDAYANSGALGWLTWLYGVVAGAFISILNVLRRILGMIGGTGAASPPQPAASTERPAQTQSESAEKDGSRPSAKMKTLKDTKDEKDEHQLYNGNQVCGPLTLDSCRTKQMHS